jgi:predicted secreted protein
MTIAAIGYGATVYLDNAAGTLTLLGEPTSIEPYGYSVDTVDATHLTSTSAHREYIAGLADVGEASVELNHDQHSATDQLLRAAMLDRGVRTFKVIWADGANFSCEGFVTAYAPGAIVADDKMSASFTVKFTGVPTFAAS